MWTSIRSLLKAKLSSLSLRTCINSSLLPVTYFKNQRSHGRYCHLFIVHMVFVPYIGLSYIWVIFLEILSSKMATNHIFQSGVRNWPASMRRCEIEVFNPQAWDSCLRRESWQIYIGNDGTIGNNGTIGTNGKAPYCNGSTGEYASIKGS